MDAWAAFKNDCTGSGEKRCPDGCQAKANSVKSSCWKGEGYNKDYDSYRRDNLSLWTTFSGYSSCDLGYTPSACQSAWFDFEAQCADYSGCTDDCQAKADAVKAGCAEEENYDPRDSHLTSKSWTLYITFGLYTRWVYMRSTCYLGYTPGACELAWDAFYSCPSLMAENCSIDCQTKAEAIRYDCADGDVYKTREPEKKYATYTLWGYYTDGSFGTRCDLGYTSNECDLALKAYSMSGAKMFDWKYLYPDATGVCAPTQNIGESCSSECAALVDAVKQSCEGKTFVPCMDKDMCASWADKNWKAVTYDPFDAEFKERFLNEDDHATVCLARFPGFTLDPSGVSTPATPALLLGVLLVFSRVLEVYSWEQGRS